MRPLKTARLGPALRHWRISTQLMLAFGLMLTLNALLGGLSYLALAQVKDASEALADTWMPSVGHMAAARAGILEVRELEIKHSHAADASYMGEYEDKLKGALAEVTKNIEGFRKLAPSPADLKLIAVFEKNWSEYLAVHRKVLELGRAGKQDDAKDVGEGAAKMTSDDAIAALDRTTTSYFKQAAAAGEHAKTVDRNAKFAMLGFVAAALLIGVALALIISRNLIRQLGGEPAVAGAVARAVAAGDLTTPVPVRPGDQTSLMAALRDMQSSLAEVVARVREGSRSVAAASAEIAQGNSDLSGRTEQQASALQETSASMSQLGQTVQRNADSADQADRLARDASDVAAKGGEAVGQVVQTMKGINDSARKIGDITGVIDSIAFQTNILALNAAVEAARAGEQGRGFAVVASEVRSLAQRSAEAAKEIKSLIGQSLTTVEQGSRNVDRAGETMQEVVTAIHRVTQIMTEISSASQEQRNGVQQVGQAVAQMDETTQQNAALVEESAAAAESLRHQADQLVQAVAVFRLEASPSV